MDGIISKNPINNATKTKKNPWKQRHPMAIECHGTLSDKFVEVLKKLWTMRSDISGGSMSTLT
jgi:hypothetical protein